MAITLLYPYATVEEVKRYIGETLTDTDKEDQIKFAINKASRLIDSMTNRLFYKKTYTDEYITTTKRYNGWALVKKLWLFESILHSNGFH